VAEDERRRSGSRGEVTQAPEQTDPTFAGAVPELRNGWRERAFAVFSRSWLFLFLLVLIGFFWLTTPSGTFLSHANLTQIGLSTSEVVVLAIGETFVIVTAGIDLSIGGILFFSAVCGGKTMLALSGTNAQVTSGQYPHATKAVLVGILVALLAGTGWGMLNGLLITFMRLPPFIVTLGTYSMTFGFGDLLSGGTYLGAPVPTSFSNNFGSGKFLGLYPPVWFALVVVLVAHVVFQYTRFGRYTAAIGSNSEASRRVGIPVDRQIIAVYTLAGFLAGCAAILDLAIYTNTTSVSHLTDNLNAISAVVLGGTSLFGGVGTMLMTAVGAFIPTVLQNGLVIKNVQPFWQEVLVGATIIFAVYLDQLRRRRLNR
jgi:ribose transport system permease protein